MTAYRFLAFKSVCW